MIANILVKHSASKCNEELMNFLHDNIKKINSKYNLKVIIVYNEMLPKLKNKITALPVMIKGETLITGNAAIKKEIMTASSISDSSDSLQDFWNSEIHSAGDNVDEEDDLMDKAKTKALERAMDQKNQPTTVKPRISNNIKQKEINIVDDDPFMKKYWENQEESPNNF